MNPYYTHRPYLIEQLKLLALKDSAKILEFGVGEGSSSILSEFSKNNPHFEVQAFETDLSWIKSMEEKYSHKNYQFFHVSDWADLFSKEEFSDVYDLIFIDQAPWEARILTLNTLIRKAKRIILHDYDFFNVGICDDVFRVDQHSFLSPYFKEYNILTESFKEILPPTLLIYNKDNE